MLNRFILIDSGGPGRYLIKKTHTETGGPVNKMLVNCIKISRKNLNRFWVFSEVILDICKMALMLEK